MSTPGVEPRFYTLEDVATILNVRVAQVYALVRSGDPITLNVAGRVLRMEVADAELAQRRAAWQPPPPRFARGYGALFSEQVTQANEGCDFEFLARPGATPAPEPNPQ